MIRSLRLTNWRNYEDLSIDFEPGTTFVVASNGVGKTSLVEAARFALFGVQSLQAGSPVRIGGTEARVSVSLELPDGRMLTVDRKVAAKRSRSAPEATISLSGEALRNEEFEPEVRDAYGTDLAFLARLVMPAATPDDDRPTALGLEAHLGRYFGVEKLQHALSALTEQINQTTKQIRSIKTAHSATAQQLATLEADVEQAASLAEAAAAEHGAASQRLDRSRTFWHAVETRSAWTERHLQVQEERQVLLREVAMKLELDQTTDLTQVPVVLSARISELNADIEDARVQQAVREARSELIVASQANLDGAHDDCPVCRRPLDDATVADAHASNEADLATFARESAAFRRRESAAESARAGLVALQQRWNGVADVGPKPELPTVEDGEDIGVEMASARLSAAVDRMVGARAAQIEADRRFEQARNSDEAIRELERLFRIEAELRIAHDTTDATLNELLEETVRPMASQVGHRWAALFPDRGRLTTRPDGTMSRSVNGHDLPYDAFSTGESIGATIVLRLLVAQMATTVDFCWFDEPLEHLDPEVRRRVANILSRASSGDSALNQIVVTTYEEALARALAARNPQRVHLVDVRQAPALTD